MLPEELTAQVHPEKNQDVKLESLTPGSNVTLWWVCSKSHEWEAKVKTRTRGSGCPYCTGNRFASGVNDLATLHPEIAAELHQAKNSGVTPSDIAPGSTKVFTWVCLEGHEWQATVVNRTRHGKKCPECHPRKNAKRSITFVPLSSLPESVLKFTDSSDLERLVDVTAQLDWVCPEDETHLWSSKLNSLALNPTCPYCTHRRVTPGVDDFQTSFPNLMEEWDWEENTVSPSSLSPGSGQRVHWVCKSDSSHKWDTFLYTRTSKTPTNCPSCNTGQSAAEQEIADLFISQGVEVIRNTRQVISPWELDLFFPEHKLAVEFNGLYWHSEQSGKSKNYHHDKWLAAKEAGVQLIQIWEDDWNRNPELVKKMLSHKLGLSNSKRFYARKTTVESISAKQARPFLEENHVQGFVAGSYYLGLTDYEGSLIAVMVLRRETKSSDVLTLARFATAAQVVGGFTKLLKHTEKLYKPSLIVTFADHTVSDGGLYENTGFVADKELPPDYMYVVKKTRVHKFNYRLKRFREDFALKYEEGLSETQLAQLNGIPRIWDAGKTRYVYKPQ